MIKAPDTQGLNIKLNYLLIIICNTIEVTRKAIAAKAVSLLSIASIVLPLFLPKKVSAPPAIEPERPACLPDCKRTTTIMKSAKSTCTIFKIIFKAATINTPNTENY